MTTTARQGPGNMPRLYRTYSAELASATYNTIEVTLAQVPLAAARPDHIVHVVPRTALTADLAIGQCYCAVAGTIVVPVINPTAGNIDSALDLAVILFETNLDGDGPQP